MVNKSELLIEGEDKRYLYFNTGLIIYETSGEPISFVNHCGSYTKNREQTERDSIENLLKELTECLSFKNWKDTEGNFYHHNFLGGLDGWVGCLHLQHYVQARNELSRRGMEIDISHYDQIMRESCKESPLFYELLDDLLKLKPDQISYSDEKSAD